MSANQDTNELVSRIERRLSILIPFSVANVLRRAEKTLQRWGEDECGSSNDFASFSIERDETTGKPFRCVYPHKETTVRRYPIADREAGALRRVAAICKEHGLHFYHQTDPRGAALYVSTEPLTAQNYTNGVSCSV